MRVLVIENEPSVARTLVKGLEANHFAVDLAEDGEAGLHFATEIAYDAVVLNWHLPKVDGLTLLTKLRKSGSLTRILFLSRTDNVADRVCALRSGANDFMVKPFSFEELLARLNTLLRRPQEVRDTITVDDLVLDRVHRAVSRAGKPITLTSREYSILECLMRNVGRVLTRTVIEAQVLNLAQESAGNVVDVFISYLRAKIDRGSARQLIHTIRGAGYTMSPAGEAGNTIVFKQIELGNEVDSGRGAGPAGKGFN